MGTAMLSLDLFFVFLLAVIAAAEENCDESGILLYEDLGCVPEHDGDSKNCPKKYSCKGLEPSLDNCFFRGKGYTDRESVDQSLSAPSCDVGCFCEAGLGFRCAILDCPEWLGVNPVGHDCYRNYTLDHCCSVGQVCPPFKDIEMCVVEGKEYREGEKFHPSNTCLRCVCQKGFKGKFEEPFCRRKSCGQQLRRDGRHISASCAPFYSKQLHEAVLCCPDHWICADGSETIQGEHKSDESCKFGAKSVKIGQFFEKVDVKDGYGRTFKKVKCECAIPPLMRCVDVSVV